MRFDVAMHDALRVRRGQRRGDLASDPQRFDLWKWSPLTKHLFEAIASDVGHDDVRRLASLSPIVDRHDARVVERSGSVRLALEAFDHGRVCAMGSIQHLHGHLAVQPGVVGQEDVSHPTGANPADQLVTLSDNLVIRFHGPISVSRVRNAQPNCAPGRPSSFNMAKVVPMSLDLVGELWGRTGNRSVLDDVQHTFVRSLVWADSSWRRERIMTIDRLPSPASRSASDDA